LAIDPETAREILLACAKELYEQAAELHGEGVVMVRRAARMEQLAKIGADDLVCEMQTALVEEGLIEVVDCGKPIGDA
jgi:hypothetical protein